MLFPISLARDGVSREVPSSTLKGGKDPASLHATPPFDCKEIQPVHSEGDQPWVFIGGNDAKAETLVLWPPHMKS